MKRILLVDDEDLGRSMMEERFEKHGEYVSVSTGEDAINAYKKSIKENNQFDLIVLDISLEDISGLKVLQTIKELEKKNNPRTQAVIIMASAYSEKKIVMKCIELGCQGYLIKPILEKSVDDIMKKLGFSHSQ